MSFLFDVFKDLVIFKRIVKKNDFPSGVASGWSLCIKEVQRPRNYASLLNSNYWSFL